MIRRLDMLVLKELIGPWIFGVSMFTMLLVAATYLGRIAKFIVNGVSASTIIHVTVLLLPAILVQTFAMALLLGALLAFGRLSGDSEITAIRAAGVSLYRIVLPVAIFSLAVAGVAFYLNEKVVPPAAVESVKLMSSIAQQTSATAAQPVMQKVVQNGKLVAMIGAKNFNPGGLGLGPPTLDGVFLMSYDSNGRENFIMYAKQFEYRQLTDWRIRGGAEIFSRDMSVHTKIDGDVWPSQYIPRLTLSPEEILASQNNDMSVYSMGQIQELIRKGKESGNLTIEQQRNYEYGYWNKIALPLAAFIFGTLGATLGIRNHRTGSATGFAISVAIIFSYFTLANFMNVYAQGGIFPPYVASFTPIAIGLVASGVIIWRRNR